MWDTDYAHLTCLDTLVLEIDIYHNGTENETLFLLHFAYIKHTIYIIMVHFETYLSLSLMVEPHI